MARSMLVLFQQQAATRGNPFSDGCVPMPINPEVSISPSLRQTEEMELMTPGLGYISAGLLLWREHNEANDE